jgi:transcriptional regulator NrdR family protein
MNLIHCPLCGNKVDERDMKDGEIIRKRCEKCEIFFWVLGEMTIRVLVDPKETKKVNK